MLDRCQNGIMVQAMSLTSHDMSRVDVAHVPELSCLLHDLANSAAGVHGLLLLLRSDGHDPLVLDMACQAAAGMVQNITDTRMALQTEHGLTVVTLVPLPVAAIFAMVERDGLGLTAYSRACGLEVVSAPSVRVLADDALLRRALINLVKNALEACPPQRRVRLEASVADGRCRLSVWHPGCMAHLTLAPGTNPGRGLGLQSVRRILAQHREATLGWNSSAENGTRFWVELPIVA
jgi:signal transduction histidine kinase